jgi:outer membrane receptor protein involved in Fe transport
MNRRNGIAPVVAAAALVLGLAAPAAFAQERAQTAEFGLQLVDMDGGTVDGTHGTQLNFDSDLAWGITGGYNITERLYVGGEWNWASPDYVLRRTPDVGGSLIPLVNAQADVSTLLFKAAFNFIEGPLTPYVEVGAGWTTTDSNVVIPGSGSSGCWWDPWWGYVCSSWYDTYSDTRSTWTYAVGFRWDLSDSIALRASYGERNVDTNYALDDITIDDLRFELAWKF